MPYPSTYSRKKINHSLTFEYIFLVGEKIHSNVNVEFVIVELKSSQI